MDPVYETRKQQIKRSKGQVYSKKHVLIQERIQAKQQDQKPKQKQKKK